MSAPIPTPSPETPGLSAEVEAKLLAELDSVLTKLGLGTYDRRAMAERTLLLATGERQRKYSENLQRQRGMAGRQIPFNGQ